MEGGGGSEFDSDAANATTFLEMGSIERDTPRDANSEENCVSSTEMPSSSSEKRIVGLSKNTISQGQQQQQGEQELATKMLQIQSQRFYLDVKQKEGEEENSRGRFLRVGQVSQTITRGGPRSQIAIPAQGMIEFRDALSDLLEEFGTGDGDFKGDLPEGRHMRVDNKNFYFDIGQNNRGIYMFISEDKTESFSCSLLAVP
ncbi:hypothetical protein J437_LFUL000962 [Ladona fulva]|uniref:Pur-alpha n=1 Tax=Ladona fulva TaxID=123851 RepID=A0A8K0KI32_LADFU|nr:hypothetical protein J437_LFUL000962 [Ladona fulva]